MKTASKKGKGRRLQNYVVEKLLFLFMLGEDIKLSPAVRKKIPYSFECKNQERLNIWSSLKQAEDNSNGYDPVLIFKRNRTKTYACVDFDLFLNLIKEK